MKRFFTIVAFGCLFAAMSGVVEAEEKLLVDEFSHDDELSALGTAWQGFTDRVMGGVSTGSVTRETIGERTCIRLRGSVSLENNGGFIQVALPLRRDRGSLDAGEFDGVRLQVRGNGEPGYYVHLRTADTRLPWQYYQAGFSAGPEWTDVRIPFSDFVPQSLDRKLDPRRLVRLGIVAAKRAFDADVAVCHVSFYR